MRYEMTARENIAVGRIDASRIPKTNDSSSLPRTRAWPTE